jgi:hypothetical protein
MTDLPRRVWVNQPSSLQPLHHLHGTLLLAVPDGPDHLRGYFLSGSVVSLRVPRMAASDGWPAHLTDKEISNGPR